MVYTNSLPKARQTGRAGVLRIARLAGKSEHLKRSPGRSLTGSPRRAVTGALMQLFNR